MVKMKVRASQVRFGDRLLDGDQERGHTVIQVRTRNGEVLVTHGQGETRYAGDPPVWVMRREPRVVNDDSELPETIWSPRTPTRLPWEGRD